MFSHQSGSCKGQETLCLAKLRQFQQGVVKIPVAVGDGDDAGSLVSLQRCKPFQSSLEDTSTVDGRSEDHQVLRAKGLGRRGGTGDVQQSGFSQGADAMAQAPRREVPVGEKTAAYMAILTRPFCYMCENSFMGHTDYRSSGVSLQEKADGLRFP